MKSRLGRWGWELSLSAAVCAVLILGMLIRSERGMALGLLLAAVATPFILISLAVRVTAALLSSVPRRHDRSRVAR